MPSSKLIRIWVYSEALTVRRYRSMLLSDGRDDVLLRKVEDLRRAATIDTMKLLTMFGEGNLVDVVGASTAVLVGRRTCALAALIGSASFGAVVRRARELLALLRGTRPRKSDEKQNCDAGENDTSLVHTTSLVVVYLPDTPVKADLIT